MKITITPLLRQELNKIYDRAVDTTSSKFFCTNLCLYIEKLYGDPKLIKYIEKTNNQLKANDEKIVGGFSKQTLKECQDLYHDLQNIIKKYKIDSKLLGLSKSDITNLILVKNHESSIQSYRMEGIYSALEKVTDALCKLNPKIEKDLQDKYNKENPFSDKPYFSAIPTYWRYKSESERLAAIRGTKNYTHWLYISSYKKFVFEPKFEDPYEKMFHAEELDGFKNVMEKDPPMDEADWSDGDNLFFSPNQDRQNLILFHDWLLNITTTSSTSSAEVEAEVGNFTSYTDGTITYLGNKVELAARPAEILRLMIQRPNERISYDEIIQTTFPIEDQSNTRKYRNLSNQIHIINKYLVEELEIDKPIAPASGSTYKFSP